MAIRLIDVTLGYDRHPAVHHLSGSFEYGSLTAVIGPNGAGKSTLLKGIKGILPSLSGRVELDGVDRAAIAYLPQQADIDQDFPISVLDVVLLGHWRGVGMFGGMGAAHRRHAQDALTAVGLKGFERRPIGSLSVGQRQRVLFARVLLEDSPVILLDEPFAAIDARTTADLLAVVGRWHGEGRTIIAVLHDFDQVRRHFPRALLLAREVIAWGETERVLTADNLLKARAMSEAWDENAAICARGAA
jgi:zinc/manganese transport system ATP-binding protein